ncbi:MAG: LPS assembly protein LptD, partial [Deltaproteobacteria bacterium]|nr:LPS assembly protein LptD [Deltaproteobacteria bacterium]
VGSAVVRDDLQNPDDMDRDDLALQRLPDIQLSVLPGEIVPELPFVASLGAEYTFFESFRNANGFFGSGQNVDGLFIDTGLDGVTDPYERDVAGLKGGFDPSGDNFPPGPEGDGVFQEGEILANAGHRLILNPRLGYPLRLFDFLEVSPEAGYREAIYATDSLGTENRGYVTGRVDLRTRLRRALDLPFGLGQATHLLEPRLGYALVSKTVVSKSPVFIPESGPQQQRLRELDLDNVTLDPADRLPSANILAGGFGNRLYGKGLDGGPPRLLADVTVLGQYDFSQDRAGELVLDGTGYPGGGIYTRFIMGYQMQEERFDEALVQTSWASARGDDLSVSYRFLDQIPLFYESFRYDKERFDSVTGSFSQVNQISVYVRWAVTRSWGLTYSGTYSADNSVFLGNQGGVEYLSQCRCWAVRFEADQDPVSGARFNVKYRIVGLGDDTVRPFAGFKGGGVLPTSKAGGAGFF